MGYTGAAWGRLFWKRHGKGDKNANPLLMAPAGGPPEKKESSCAFSCCLWQGILTLSRRAPPSFRPAMGRPRSRRFCAAIEAKCRK